MNIEQLTLDARIDAQHQELARGEEDALQILKRLKTIPGCEGIVRRKRTYGELPNPWAGQGNMTAQAAVANADPALAGYLARKAGKSLPAPNYERQQAEEQRAASIARLEEQTAAMRERNIARRKQQEREQTYGRIDRWTGRIV